MWIGSARNSNKKPFRINWPNYPIKALGVHFSKHKKAAENANFVDKFEKLK